PAIDLAEPALAIDVVAIFRSIAIARGPSDGLDHLGTLDPRELTKLLLQEPQPPRGDVVLDARRQQIGLVGELVLGLGFLGEGFAHRHAQSGSLSILTPER